MNIKKTLENSGISSTEVRTQVLGSLSKSKYLLSASEILKKNTEMDRVTLFRTLQLFVKSGLIDRVADTSGTVYYAIKKSGDEHMLYFKCNNCEKVEPLIPVAIDKLNKKYTPEEYNLLVQGKCKNCK